MSEMTDAPLPLSPPGPRLALGLGFELGRARLTQRSTMLTALLCIALVATSAFIERRVGSAGAVDRSLVSTFQLIIPLVTFAIMRTASGRTRLDLGTMPLARYGAPRPYLALGLILAAAVTAALFSALLSMESVLLAHSSVSPPLARDLFQSAWIGALTAAAYATLFAFGGSFGERGRGRWVPLVADFLLGRGASLFGVVFPRANAQNLLGGAAPLGLSQAASSLVLAALLILFATLATLRARE